MSYPHLSYFILTAYEGDAITFIPIFQLRKLMLREAKPLAQGHTAY